MGHLYKVFLSVVLLVSFLVSFAQAQPVDSNRTVTIIAGPEYNRSKSFQNLWGINRRQEWLTPVKAPLFWLDSVRGGLTVYKGGGGGNETKSLRLRSRDRREFVLRSINKSRAEVVPEFARGTFIENVIQDGVSMSHPFGAFALAGMQAAAGIHHTRPQLVYLPEQSALDTFNHFFANDLYMFEERPDEDWSEASHMGGFSNYSGTDKVIENLLEDSQDKVNQFAFAKTRLFDMLIGDWDRHADNFRWGRKDTGDHKWYEPVPRDRDQSFFHHDGIFIDRLIKLGGYSFMKEFSEKVDDVDDVPGQQKDMDMFFTNALSKEDWIKAAIQLQQALTDSVIDHSLKGMPLEIYAISGEKILKILIARREQLQHIAAAYYSFLAKEVNIPLSSKSESVIISSPQQNKTAIAVYALNIKKHQEQKPVYQRVFSNDETKAISIYGIGGNDYYLIEENLANIKIKIIGGPGYDSIVQTGGKNIMVYDKGSNHIQLTNALQMLSAKDSLPQFHFRSQPIKKAKIGIAPHLFFSENEIYKRGLGVSTWLTIPKVIGGWNASVTAYFTPVKWNNYFGVGNETLNPSGSYRYNQFLSTEFGGNAGLSRRSKKSLLGVYGIYHWTKARQDSSGFVSKTIQPDTAFQANTYAGIKAQYNFTSLNDNVVPTRGFVLRTEAGLVHNFQQDIAFQDYKVKLNMFLPVSKKFSFAIKGGGHLLISDQKIANNAQLFQHATIGGAESLRGYVANRFWGNTAYYNQNELRFITDMRSYLLNAKIGFLLFADNGRVWRRDEESGTIHTSYGGGLIFAPFYNINTTLTYGVSKEASIFQFTLNTGF